VLQWGLVHVRKGVLVVYDLGAALREFIVWAEQVFVCCGAAQLYLFLTFMAWYAESLPAVMAGVRREGSDYVYMWELHEDILLATCFLRSKRYDVSVPYM